MIRIQLFLSLSLFSFNSTFSQINFVGLTDEINYKINIIFRGNNYGSVEAGDTIIVFDNSAYHLYCVDRISNDSISDRNFIGGEYQDSSGSLVYFTKSLSANYVKTIPYGDYALAREIGSFFYQNNYFLCLKINGIRKISYSNFKDLVYQDIRYDFEEKKIYCKREIKQCVLKGFYRANVSLGSSKSFSLIILNDQVDSEERIKIFFKGNLLASILVSLER